MSDAEPQINSVTPVQRYVLLALNLTPPKRNGRFGFQLSFPFLGLLGGLTWIYTQYDARQKQLAEINKAHQDEDERLLNSN
jgi:hypothetical protein